ncbi:MAG: hypothetical protein IPK03_12380 [Bacteroidetes bacterium]|nr:hypothetical protein [Bacteroidota bacterium]
MDLQYLSDHDGKRTAVIIPLDKWEEITLKHRDVIAMVEAEEIPNFVQEEVQHRLDYAKKNPQDLIDWQKGIDKIKK